MRCALFKESGPNLHVIGRAPLQQVGQLQANSLGISRGARGDARAADCAAAVAAAAVADLLRRVRPGLPCRLLRSQAAGNPVPVITLSTCQRCHLRRRGALRMMRSLMAAASRPDVGHALAARHSWHGQEGRRIGYEPPCMVMRPVASAAVLCSKAGVTTCQHRYPLPE